MKAFFRSLFRERNAPYVTDDTLYRWDQDRLTWPHLLAGGLLCVGMTGAGKTSSFHLLAMAMLNDLAYSPTLLVLTAKPTDLGDWLRLYQRLKHAVDWVHIHPTSGHRINLLAYELLRPGGSVQSAASFFKLLNEIAMRSTGGNENEGAFWANLFDVLIQAAITIALLANDVPTLLDVYRIIISLPQSLEQAVDDKWTRNSYCGQMLAKASRKIQTGAEERKLRRCIDVVLTEMPSVGERARGAAVSMVNGILSKFLTEPWHDMLSCQQSNFTPDDLFTGPRGKLVILDFPVLQWGDAGRFFQILFTMLVQSACLRRDVNLHPRPVIIVRDEVQLYCHGEWDARVMGVARSQKLIHCSLFQTLPTLIGTGFGGSEKARYEAMTFLSGHANIFCYANNCSETNQHFADLLGKSRKLFFGGGSGGQTQPRGFMDDLLGVGAVPQVSWSEQLDHLCPPSEFLKLRTGGSNHRGLIDAIWFQGGRRFSNGKIFRKVTFQQEF